MVETIQDYPSSYSYMTTQNQNVYYIPSVVLGKEYIKVIVNGVIISSNVYDVINNSLVLYFKPLDGLVLQVKVASSVKGITQLDFETSQEAVLDAMVKMNALIKDIDVIKNVRNNLTVITSVANNMVNISLVSSSSQVIKSISDNIGMFDSPDIKHHNSAINRDTPNSHTMESITGLIQAINSIQLAGVFPTKYRNFKEESYYVLAKQNSQVVSLNIKALQNRIFKGDFTLNPYFNSGLLYTDVYGCFPNYTYKEDNLSKTQMVLNVPAIGSVDMIKHIGEGGRYCISLEGYIYSLSPYDDSNIKPAMSNVLIGRPSFSVNKVISDATSSRVLAGVDNDNKLNVFEYNPHRFGNTFKKIRSFNMNTSYPNVLYVAFNDTYTVITDFIKKESSSLINTIKNISYSIYTDVTYNGISYTPMRSGSSYIKHSAPSYWSSKGHKMIYYNTSGFTNILVLDLIKFLTDDTTTDFMTRFNKYVYNLTEDILNNFDVSMYTKINLYITKQSLDTKNKRFIFELTKTSGGNVYVYFDIKNKIKIELNTAGENYAPLLLPRDVEGNVYTYHKAAGQIIIRKNNQPISRFIIGTYDITPPLLDVNNIHPDDYYFITDVEDY